MSVKVNEETRLVAGHSHSWAMQPVPAYTRLCNINISNSIPLYFTAVFAILYWNYASSFGQAPDLYSPAARSMATRGPFYYHGLILIPAWIINQAPSKVWDVITYPILKQQRLHRWSLGMNTWFHPTFYNGCNYLSVLELKLNHVSKKDPTSY